MDAQDNGHTSTRTRPRDARHNSQPGRPGSQNNVQHSHNSARLLTAFHIGGVCRAVAYELLTYWSPGGDVFPSVKTLADDMGLKRRVVRHHIAHLERVGLWVRIGRKGQTNLYGLHLPGEAQEGFVPTFTPAHTCRPPRHTRAA